MRVKVNRPTNLPYRWCVGSCQFLLRRPQSTSSTNTSELQSWDDFVVEVELVSFESTEVKKLMSRRPPACQRSLQSWDNFVVEVDLLSFGDRRFSIKFYLLFNQECDSSVRATIFEIVCVGTTIYSPE